MDTFEKALGSSADQELDGNERGLQGSVVYLGQKEKERKQRDI